MRKKYPLDKLRNIGIVAHIDAGKTTTTERILFYSGFLHRVGEVHEGSSFTDWMQQEKERGITITSAAVSCFWQDHQINIIDTPGHVDFTAEVERALRVLDGMVAVFCAVGGVQPQSETVWRQANHYKVPSIAFVNKMDRVGANYNKVIQDIRKKLGGNAHPIFMPIGAENDFEGVIDVIKQKAYFYTSETGDTYEEKDIPADLVDEVQITKEQLIEAVGEVDDDVMMKYIEGEEISDEELRAGIRKATLANKLVPVCCGSAFKNKGVQALLDSVIDYLPSPQDIPEVTGLDLDENPITIKCGDDEPFCGLAFKIQTDPYVGKLTYFRVYSGKLSNGTAVMNTTKGKRERINRVLQMQADTRNEVAEVSTGDIIALVGLKQTGTGDTLCAMDKQVLLESITFPDPVISVAIEPTTQAMQDKLTQVLIKLAEEDPTFKSTIDNETGQTIISGMGELHLDILVDRVKREFNVDVRVGKQQVSYRETITRKAKGEGRFVRQSGGKGQYGHVILDVEPAEPGTGYQFVNNIPGNNPTKTFSSAIDQGIQECMKGGFIAGYELIDLKVTVYDGSTHEVDSSELAFKIAGSMALKDALAKAGTILVEPVMKVDAESPEEYVGDIIADLNSRRARIEGINPQEGLNVTLITAKAPLSEMFGYATSIRSISQGRGTFSMQFAQYDPVPQGIQKELTNPTPSKV